MTHTIAYQSWYKYEILRPYHSPKYQPSCDAYSKPTFIVVVGHPLQILPMEVIKRSALLDPKSATKRRSDDETDPILPPNPFPFTIHSLPHQELSKSQRKRRQGCWKLPEKMLFK